MSSSGPDREQLVSFLGTIAKPGASLVALDDDSHLVTSGVIDSLAILEIILYLEREFDIDIQAARIDPTTLVTLRGIMQAIEQGR